MTKVINIQDVVLNSKKLLPLFDKINNSINDMNTNYKDAIDDYCIELFNFFKEIYNKLKMNKLVVNNPKIIIDKTNLFDYIDDEINKLLCKLEFIRLYFITKGKVLKLTDEYIKLLTESIVEINDINVNMYTKIIDYLSVVEVKKIIDSSDSFKNKKLELLDIISLIKDGYNPLEIRLFYTDNVDSNSLEDGIITINKIHDYYINQATFFNDLTEEINFDINNIEKILLLNSFDNKLQNKFIELVKVISSTSINLEDELKLISDLVIIFLDYKEKIGKIDIDRLKSLLFYKNINKKTIEEVSDIFERRL